MALIFRNPVLSTLEDKLWERARERYIDEGGSPIEDIKQLDRKTRRQLRRWVKEWHSSEDKKLKPIWREFKQSVALQTTQTLALVFERSDQSWYSREVGNLADFPEVGRVFEVVIDDALSGYKHFKIGVYYTRFIIAQVIRRDFYSLNRQSAASRIDMVILSVFDENWNDRDADKHKGEKAAVRKWRITVDKGDRNDDRRFKSHNWELEQGELEAMASK